MSACPDTLTRKSSHGLQYLLLELACPSQISLRAQRHGKIVHGCQCVWVLLTQKSSVGLERVLLELAPA